MLFRPDFCRRSSRPFPRLVIVLVVGWCGFMNVPDEKRGFLDVSVAEERCHGMGFSFKYLGRSDGIDEGEIHWRRGGE